MSRRFGRNQRRRAREAIAAAEASFRLARSVSEHLSQRKRELESILHEAMDIAGQMSVLFAPSTVDTVIPREVLRECGIRLETRIDGAKGPGDWQSTSAWAPVEALPVLLSYFQSSDFDQCQHAIIEFDGTKSGYAISRKSIALLTEQQLVDRILREVAPTLVRHLVAQLKGRA